MRRISHKMVLASVGILAIGGCGGKGEKETEGADPGKPIATDATAEVKGYQKQAPDADKKPSRWAADPFPSTYVPYPSGTTVLRGATLLTGTGTRIDNGVVVIENGKIASVGGADVAAPAGATIVEAKGKWVTPGVIDIQNQLTIGGKGQARAVGKTEAEPTPLA